MEKPETLPAYVLRPLKRHCRARVVMSAVEPSDGTYLPAREFIGYTAPMAPRTRSGTRCGSQSNCGA